jgi:ribosomal RNA-processing protein 9
VRVWNTATKALAGRFKGHVDTITSIKFDNVNDHLYSVSADTTLKIWNMREMCYIDTHNGHIGPALDLHAYSADRVVSCGDDRQVIFWKVIEDTQLLYKNTKNDTCCLSILDDEYFVTGSIESAIDLWTFKKKKPIYKLKDCHKNHTPNNIHDNAWITTISSIRNSDLLCSASIDSSINLYKFSRENKNIEKLGALPKGEDSFIPGTVNTVKFSPKRSYLAYTHSDEQKLGRWFTTKPTKGGISIVKLAFK